MRQKHNPQSSILEYYSDHKFGQQLKAISDCLDSFHQCLDSLSFQSLSRYWDGSISSSSLQATIS